MMTSIKDLSTAAPEEVIVRVGNGEDIKEIDLSFVPAISTLMFTEAARKHGSIAAIPDDEMIPAVAQVCRRTCPEVTADWLQTCLTRPQLTALCDIVLAQTFRMWGSAPRGEDPKNP